MYPEVSKLKEELERFNKETAERVRKIIDEYREYLEYCEYCTEEEMCFRHKVPLMILVRGGSVHIDASPEAMVEGKKEEYIYYTVYVSINYLYHLRANKDKTVIRRKRFNNHYPTAYKEGLKALFEYKNHGHRALAEDDPSAHRFIREIADKLTFLTAPP